MENTFENQKNLEQKDLDFEEFKKRVNNFYLIFVNLEDNVYRQKKFLDILKKENQKLLTKLDQSIGKNFKKRLNNSKSVFKVIKPFLDDLYEAYKILKKHFNNKELFLNLGTIH